jgi:hypothetical protein
VQITLNLPQTEAERLLGIACHGVLQACATRHQLGGVGPAPDQLRQDTWMVIADTINQALQREQASEPPQPPDVLVELPEIPSPIVEEDDRVSTGEMLLQAIDQRSWLT